MWSALGHGLWAFLKQYIAKRGLKNGWAGFVIALGNFEGTFYRYAKRYEQDATGSRHRASGWRNRSVSAQS